MIVLWLATGLVANDNTAAVAGGKSKYREKRNSAAAVAKPVSVQPTVKTRFVAPPAAIPATEIEFRGKLPGVSLALSIQHIEPVAVSLIGSLPGMSAGLALTHELPKSQIERYLEAYGVADCRAVAKQIMAALKARASTEQPKAIIRDILSRAGVADRRLQLLTSLIFTAWTARRTIILEAA